MGEPLSVVGLALGAIGFVGAVRNLAQRLTEDVDNFQKDHERITTLIHRLQFVTDQLTLWQNRWSIDEKTSDKLLESHWGPSMAYTIRPALKHIRDKTQSIENEINKRYSNALKDLRITQEELPRRDRQKEFPRKPSKGRRIVNVIFNDQTFSRHFKDLEDAVVKLMKASKSRFMVHQNLKTEEDLHEAVPNAVLRHCLKQLQPASTTEFSRLQKRFSTLQKYACELRLSHCASPLDRLDTLRGYANEENLKYHFLISHDAATTHDSIQSFCCYRIDDFQSFETIEDVGHFFGRRIKLEAAKNYSFAAGSSVFGLFYSKGREQYQTSTSLRAYIRETSCDYNTRLQGAFTMRQRTQIAYEVAECAFLFLSKRFLSNICSCGISKVKTPGSIGEFTLRLGAIIHHDSEPWCSQKWWKRMPIRRFGVLLVEIFLVKVIWDAVYQRGTRSIEIDFDPDTPEDGEAFDQEAIVNRVREEANSQGMGDDFANVVEYCLTQDTPLDDISEDILDEFFEQVVLP